MSPRPPKRQKRLAKDENLVLNVAQRTKALIEIALEVWPILQDRSLSSEVT